MHAFRRFIHERMDALGWKPAELARRSGLSIQLVSQLLKDDRERLGAIPKQGTLEGLARAFNVPESTVMAAVFEGMGYDLGEVRDATDLSSVPSERLLRALADRLSVSLDEEVEDDGTSSQAEAQTTRAPVSGAGKVHELRGSEYVPEASDEQDAGTHGQPAAAYPKKGKQSPGRRQRKQHREAGEESQDTGEDGPS